MQRQRCLQKYSPNEHMPNFDSQCQVLFRNQLKQDLICHMPWVLFITLKQKKINIVP